MGRQFSSGAERLSRDVKRFTGWHNCFDVIHWLQGVCNVWLAGASEFAFFWQHPESAVSGMSQPNPSAHWTSGGDHNGFCTTASHLNLRY